MIFGEQKNEKATRGLLEDVLKEKIEVINLEQTPYLIGHQADDKIRNCRCKSKDKQ